MPVTRSPAMRSKLFVPGSRPELFDKAWNSAADAISFDLEDAVAADRKAEARDHVAASLAQYAGHAKIAIVRVNPWGEELFDDDMDAVVRPGLDIVNLPKIESPEPILATARLLDRLESERGIGRRIGILANIETPRGLRMAAEIALSHERVIGLQLGFGDLFEPLAIERSPAALLPVRLAVRFAAAEAGIDAFDGAFVAVADDGAYRADAEGGRAVGLAGKSCVHPSQIAIANAVFFPRPAEIENARRIVATADEMLARGVGAFTVDGVMADGPFIARARAILELARSAGQDV
ncbi:CoA ester lyase [Bosea sp. (in: a-proteobacteria)]|uniref:HpcH/HpaI aldolase/citrate lyase family protein n=1 Tax=Bosea sp. (in: a-proteobacteria) TaxID=1871050 RepID=UPI00260ED4B1|nr:CoA ester lyase [Bosea sp. (in: a-proteobacteria)]MCO5091672.1 CoA ester lyase [Bosea sp. (in: a-proteobacteria)]